MSGVLLMLLLVPIFIKASTSLSMEYLQTSILSKRIWHLYPVHDVWTHIFFEVVGQKL